MFAVGRFEQRICRVAVGEALRRAIEHQLLLPDAVRGIGQMNQAGAVVSLLDVAVRLFPRARLESLLTRSPTEASRQV